MKEFAINFLSDVLGRESLNNYGQNHIQAFSNYLVYLINIEISLADGLNKFSVESLVKNGVFGNGSGMGYGEHLIQIDLSYGTFTDNITWDICNPDNQPEDFAA